MLLEDSFSTLISMGFRYFEVFINTCSELKGDYLKRLRRRGEKSGSKVKSLHPFTSGYENFLLFSEYERRFEDALEFYRRYFNACNLLGADLLVLHGQRRDRRSISEEETFRRYERLYFLGKTFGVTVAQENVSSCSSDDPGFVRRMRQVCGENCAFVFDVKQAVRGGTPPLTLLSAMGKSVVHVHINDHNAESDCLLPGSGAMDYAPMMKVLRSSGFDGGVMIEVYRKSFGAVGELLRAKRFVEGLISRA